MTGKSESAELPVVHYMHCVLFLHLMDEALKFLCLQWVSVDFAGKRLTKRRREELEILRQPVSSLALFHIRVL